MGKKKLSGAAKRKKKKVKEEAIAEAAADLERLKLGPTKLWTGLVTHHRDVFVSHVLPKLNTTDRFFFSKANTESLELLEYAGVDESEEDLYVHECSSLSTLEWAWNNINWGLKFEDGVELDQAWFCWRVAATNKFKLLKWVREEKKCEWDEWTINEAALEGNLEMLKYCFANGCPYDEKGACPDAAQEGHLDCLRFLFDKMKPLPETEREAGGEAIRHGHLDVLKYFVEERKVSDDVKARYVGCSAGFGRLDCLKYLVEEVKAPLDCQYIATAQYMEQTECLHYLREKGSPEPTDEEYAIFVRRMKEREIKSEQNSALAERERELRA